jgi:hypothetical protein
MSENNKSKPMNVGDIGKPIIISELMRKVSA